jgi:hypothetical protein
MIQRLAVLVAIPLCAAVFGGAQVPGTGHIEIKNVRTSNVRSVPKPSGIVVYNFTASPDEVKLNQSAPSRVRERVSGASEEDKEKLAQKVVEDFTNTLTKELEKSGIPVSRGISGDLPPDGSLAVQGEFLAIDEGNRARRMAIGLGAGASKVIAHVNCYLKHASANTTVTEFQAVSQSSRKPGAAETMGAGAAPEAAAAVGGVTEMKQGAEGDADRMAKAIAKQILKALAAQGWAATT